MIIRRKWRFYKGELNDILRLSLMLRAGNGEYIRLFEEEFAKYIGTRFAIATCSGREGLGLLLDAMELGMGDEIILPSYTLKDLVYLIRAKGLVPQLVDVEKGSFNMNPDLIKDRVGPKTRVILATHLFGLPCNLEKILDIAGSYNLKIIEDCAHAAGAKYKGKRLGSFGDTAFFSFETPKPINTFGGGAITTDKEKIAMAVRDKLKRTSGQARVLTKIALNSLDYLVIISPLYRLLLSFFMFKTTSKMISKFYLSFHKTARITHSGLTNLQALMALRQLNTLDERNKKRIEVAEKLILRLHKDISVQKGAFDDGRIFYFFVVNLPITEGTEEVRRMLFQAGVDAGIKEEITDNCAQALGNNQDYPIAEEIYNANLQLPIYDNMGEEEIIKVSALLNKILSDAHKLYM